MRTASSTFCGILGGALGGAIGLPLYTVLFMCGTLPFTVSRGYAPRISWLDFFLTRLWSHTAVVGAILGGLTAYLFINYRAALALPGETKQVARICGLGGLAIALYSLWAPLQSLQRNLAFLSSSPSHPGALRTFILWWCSLLVFNVPFMWGMLLVLGSLYYRWRHQYNQQPMANNRPLITDYR